MSGIIVLDNLLTNPEEYRATALHQEFRTYDFGHCKFHGIAVNGVERCVAQLTKEFPDFDPALSFFRKSPLDQEEPNDIHTDVDMGNCTAILYLNPNPPASDGTRFWWNTESGTSGSEVPHKYSTLGHDRKQWISYRFVQAQFNRLLIFDSTLFHSRAIPENWGTGDEARLTQVTFGNGRF